MITRPQVDLSFVDLEEAVEAGEVLEVGIWEADAVRMIDPLAVVTPHGELAAQLAGWVSTRFLFLQRGVLVERVDWNLCRLFLATSAHSWHLDLELV